MNLSFDKLQQISCLLACILLAALLSGCASMIENNQRQVASVLSYLFPGEEDVPEISDKIAEIKVPFRIGVAFVPDSTSPGFRLPESDRIKLAGLVRDSFSSYPFVRDIVAVPSVYLKSGGGFTNLERISALLNLDVIVLVSFDQVQNAGASGWSFLYWTGIGAYIINGDQYDILTSVETTVFEIKSRRLLMRAGGMSNIKGTATMVGFSERAREARTQGFDKAVQEMIDELHSEVKTFRKHAKNDPMIKLLLPEGYDPNATHKNPDGP